MSLCRWSSMNWMCDLYIYEGEGGWVCHVGSNRLDKEPPNVSLTDLLEGGDKEKFIKDYKAQMESLETATRSPIKGPYDGESFYDMDDQELHELLLKLRAAGYNFPDYALEVDLELE